MYEESIVDAPDYYSSAGSFSSGSNTIRSAGISYDERLVDVPDYYSTSSSIGNTVSSATTGSGSSMGCTYQHLPHHQRSSKAGMHPPPLSYSDKYATLPRGSRDQSYGTMAQVPYGQSHGERYGHGMPLSTLDRNGHYGVVRSTQVVTQHAPGGQHIGKRDLLTFTPLQCEIDNFHVYKYIVNDQQNYQSL